MWTPRSVRPSTILRKSPRLRASRFLRVTKHCIAFATKLRMASSWGCFTSLAGNFVGVQGQTFELADLVLIQGADARVITRLLTQMERVFNINQLKHLSPAVVETARENLVIGQV
jgi:hypothetical protein